MIFANNPPPLSPERVAINASYLVDEAALIETLLPLAELTQPVTARVQDYARRLVAVVRKKLHTGGGLGAFLREYDLSSEEGVLLMCLAEALLRIPDPATADRLIHDVLAKGEWAKHLGQSDSMLVNAATFGLILTGQFVRMPASREGAFALVEKMLVKSGEPVIRQALMQAMRILAHQFVMGASIEEALERSGRGEMRAYRFSYDMLGEAALCAEDAAAYHQTYLRAINAIGKARTVSDTFEAPGISIKLSALHPRFEFSQRERLAAELVPRLLSLCEAARDADIGVTLDAEEADLLDILLDAFEAVFGNPSLASWEGLGIAVQAYQKRALPVIDWLIALARQRSKRIPVRLVKGAYWDTEIKRAQVQGLSSYPVFTRKAATDVSFLACAQRLKEAGEWVYPQFATHNAHTVAYVLEMMGGRRDFEFQRLHGMGVELYGEIIGKGNSGAFCRVYAPVGNYRELLPYLVRRLLENGANTSFVNLVDDDKGAAGKLNADPVQAAGRLSRQSNPRIPLPVNLYGAERRNSLGLNLTDSATLLELDQAMSNAVAHPVMAAPLVGGKNVAGVMQEVRDPNDQRRLVGNVSLADHEAVEQAMKTTAAAAQDWQRTAISERAACLERAADLFEMHHAELMALCIREGGRTIPDALAEVREAVDYFRYYAAQARQLQDAPLELPGPSGERNELALHGRGVFVCISPWNFPLAIFTGQIAAALVAGNAVVAKPAGQTPLIAHRVIQLLHAAGVPGDVLAFLPGHGQDLATRLLPDMRVAGVAFTGSAETAHAINRALAARSGPIVPLIAETGGQNALIADSSALPEQLVRDVLQSAFNSAGQRCSALRVLFLQEEIAPGVIRLLKAAMDELRIGDAALFDTDIGPVIDRAAVEMLDKHAARMAQLGNLVHRLPLPPETGHGTFFAPHIFEIRSLSLLEREVFGPILHLIQYQAAHLDQVIDAINATGYGLTLGIHSRIEATARYIQQRTRAGNTYVNRNMIGAVVGVQPFGDEGLSGTGPKAGGPYYLHRFVTERTLTINTAAIGGNAALLSRANDGD